MPKKPKPAKKAGTAVAVAKVQQLAAPTSFDEFLNRAARDPNFNIETFKAVLEAKERQDAREAERRFNDAMAACQAALEPLRADLVNEQTSSKFASDIALDKALRPIYSKYGFSLSYGTGEGAPSEHVRVTCLISCGGHSRLEHFDVPADGKGPKGGAVMTKTHAAMSALTVGRRCLETIIFNLKIIKPKMKNGVEVPEPLADDDGNAAGGLDSSKITLAQCKKIDAELKDTNSDLPAFLFMMTKLNGDIMIKSTAEIPAALYEQAMAKLAQKRATMAKVA